MTDDKLLYPRPKANDFHVHRLLHDLQEDEALFQRFLDDPSSVLDSYSNVDDDAKRLIAEKDYAGLEARGIHPIMIVQFQRHVEWGLRMTTERDTAVSVTNAAT